MEIKELKLGAIYKLYWGLEVTIYNDIKFNNLYKVTKSSPQNVFKVDDIVFISLNSFMDAEEVK
jgi:hypothetical protein